MLVHNLKSSKEQSKSIKSLKSQQKEGRSTKREPENPALREDSKFSAGNRG
jgi:hypothetical protein